MLIRVENQGHGLIREFRDSPENDLMALARRMADSSEVLRIIDSHSDTMLNRFQQRKLSEELNDLLSRSMLTPDEEPIARLMIGAVEEVYENAGFVMICPSPHRVDGGSNH